MTDLLKKIFTVGVVATTIIWSVGASLMVTQYAVAADSPAFTAGQKVKVPGFKDIYVIDKDGAMMAFTNGDDFKSWTKDGKYGGYTHITLAQSEAAATRKVAPLTVGARFGTYVVKREASEKLYVIEPGNVLVPITTAAATGLYGTLKNNVNLRTIPLANWSSVYTVKDDSQQITTAAPFNGFMWKTDGNYYIMLDGVVRMETAAALSVNGQNPKFFLSKPASFMAGLPTGATIDGLLTVLSDCTGTGITGTTPVSGSGLTVAVAGTTPVASTIVSDSTNGGQSLVPALNLNFTASNDGDVVVKTLKLTRLGISADGDVANMYLYDGNTLVASSPSVATKVYTFNNSNGLFTVSRGSTKTLTVKFDLTGNTDAGKTIGFGVAANSDVVTGGGSVNGSFPANGNLLTTAKVSDLGKFTLTTVSPSANGTVDPGNTGYEIWRFTASTQSQDVNMESLRFTLIGSLNVGDLKNFTLWDASTQMGSTVADMSSDKTVTFTFPSGYKFTKGSVRNLSLRADVVGGSTRTFYASIQNSSDMVVKDLGYNVYLQHNGSSSFTVIRPANSAAYTIGSGNLSISASADSPTGNVASSTTGVTLASFDVSATGENVKITQMSLKCNDATNNNATLKNVKLLVNGSQVGSTVATSDICNNVLHTAMNYTNLGNTFIVNVGTVSKVTVVADLTGATSANDTLVVSIADGTAQGMVSMNAPTVAGTSGRTLTVASGTLTAIANPGFGNKSTNNPTGTINAPSVKIGSFNIIGGAGEDADVSSISFLDLTATNANSYLSGYAKNVKLMHGTTQLGATLVNPADGSVTAQTHTFNISPAVVVPKGTQYTVDIYADLKSSTFTDAYGLVKLSSVVANGHVTGASATYTPAAGVTLQNVYITNNGTLTIAVNGNTPAATNLLMGAVDQTLGQFDFTASSDENLNLTQLVVSMADTAAATGTLKNVRLYDDTGALVGAAVGGFDTASASSTYSHAVFNNLNLTIPAGQTKTITVKADVNTYIDGGFSTTGQAVQLAILPHYYGTNGLPLTGTGAQSGAPLTAAKVTFTANAGTAPQYTTAAAATQLATNVGNVRANEMVIYRAKLNIAWASDTPTGLSSGASNQTVGHFNVTNLANAGSYKATVKYMNFSISTTITNSAGSDNYLKIYKDSISGANLMATTDFTGGADIAHNIGNTGFGAADWNSGNGVEIPAGTTKTFYVTLDTGAATAGKTLSVTIPFSHTAMGNTGTKYGFYWYDGVSNTTANDNQLPLLSKSFSY